MKGDFSKSTFKPLDNFTGVLHQQGRVLLDQDWNAGTNVNRHLRQLLGMDTIGPDLVGIPADQRDGLRVLQATADSTGVTVRVEPGRGWIDGLHLYLDGTAPLDLVAEYLAPPIQDPQADTSSIAAGVRDAVILDVWEEAFSAFQHPRQLLEPALGGPDTTERIQLAYAVKLLRLEDGEHCGNIADKLADDSGAKGRLTVTPAPTVTIAGACPVQDGGGYSGFEHYFYRVEIVDPDATGQDRFKWSRFNGGLVGRGTFDSATDRITITSNDQAINHSGLTDFHFEALSPDPNGGHWHVVFSATASLIQDGVLQLTNLSGTWPGTPAHPTAFFRLWDGIELIVDFPTGLPQPGELNDGIRLEFDPPATGKYTPGDYWSFPVRAAGVDFDPAVWPSNAPPEGVHHHRAPLAILNWNAAPTVTLSGPAEIDDCRDVFQPLTRQDDCCTYTVGDGMHSHGDFDSIGEALIHLPPAGGRICVLPGTYEENVVVDRSHVQIHGCGLRSKVVSAAAAGPAPPVFTIEGAEQVSIDGLRVEAHDSGIGIHVVADGAGNIPDEIRLEKLSVLGGPECPIRIDQGRRISILECEVVVRDAAGPWAGIYLVADEAHLEHNTIRVLVDTAVAGTLDDVGGTNTKAHGRGGMHVGGLSARVRIIDNLIVGGAGNGITLGSLEEIDGNGSVVDPNPGWVIDSDDPCEPGDSYVPPGQGTEEEPSYRSAGPLRLIRIERNRIFDMGLNGIGVVAFFDLSQDDELISVESLEILGNTIRGCVSQSLEVIPDELDGFMGYGGIALADVEDLVLHDNVIEDNGPDHLDPVCGVYVLHVAGAGISRNRIVNNGAKTIQSVESARKGPRAGIFLKFAVPPVVAEEIDGDFLPRQNGVPAVSIHGNVVSQPLGQAVAFNALGPVSVDGNQLTSRGVVPEFSLDNSSLIAATVLIFNLGLSNELYLQNAAFSGAEFGVDAVGNPIVDEEAILVPREGLDDHKSGSYLANGNVLFTNNQVVTDLVEEGTSLSASAILIVTLDDLAFVDNQSDCNLRDDFMLTNGLFLAWSLRIADNRFKEGLFRALYSSIGVGLIMNLTCNNQATHCLWTIDPGLSIGLPPRTHSNHVWISGFSEKWCQLLTGGDPQG